MTARPRAAKTFRIQNPASPSCFAVITACISCVIVVMAPRGTIAGSMHGDAEHVPLASIVEASDVLFDALRDTLAR